MADNKKSLTRIYDLRVLGGDAVKRALKDINVALEENAKLKKVASKNTFTATDALEIEKYRERIKELTVEELKLKAAQKEATNESKQLSLARQQAANDAKKEKESIEVVAGSYRDVVNQMKILRPLIQNANASSVIGFNGRDLNFNEAIAKFKELSAAEQSFRRQFQKDGTLVGEYTTGIIQAFQQSGLDDVIKNQLQKAKTELRSLDENFDILKKELSEIGVVGSEGFNRIEREMVENRNEANRLRDSVATIEDQMVQTSSVGARISTGLTKGFAGVRRSIGTMLGAYIGFQAALSKGTQLVRNASAMSDAITDLEINMDKARGGADDLAEALRGIDTRTSLQGLIDISNIALKAGVSNENILGVTKAIDQVKVAFGKDFGSVEKGTEDFAKLIKVFYDDGEITEERILKMGNAIRALANETTASVPYITEFNGRMAGLRQQFKNFEFSQSIGLAAGFEEFKQSSETASTALVKVLPKLATDTEKYGAIIGKTAKEFGELINNNPSEALLQVAEALIKSGNGVEEISKAMADSELGSGRISTILATLGGNADTFRSRIARAGETIKSTDAITGAFAKKNENLAAIMEKISNSFNNLAGSKSFLIILNAIAVAITGLIASLPALITMLSLYATGWLLANKQMIIAGVQMRLQRNLVPLLTVIFGNAELATKRWTQATNLLTKAKLLLTKALQNQYFRAFIGVIGLSIIAIKTFGTSINSVARSVDVLVQRNKFLNEVNAEATKIVSETKAKEEALLSIIKDRTLADEVRNRALTDLKKIMGEYGEALTLETVLTDKGTKALADYNNQLERRARVTAASAIAEREAQKLTRLYQYQSDIATARATGGSIDTKNFDEDFLTAFYKQQGRSASAIGKAIGDKLGISFTYSGKDLDDFARLVRNQIDTQLKNTTAAELAKFQTEQSGRMTKTWSDEQMALQSRIIEIRKSLREELSAYGGATERYKELVKELKALEAQLYPSGTAGSASENNQTFYERFKSLMTEGTDEDFDKLLKDIADRKSKLIRASAEYKELSKLEEQIRDFLTPSKNGAGKERSATENLKRSYEQEKKILETQFSDKEITEELYQTKLLELATLYREKKLKMITAKNKEEKEQQDDFNNNLAKDQSAANDKLFSIQSAALQKQKEAAQRIAQGTLDASDDTTGLKESERLKAKLDFYATSLKSEQEYDAAMKVLEVRYGIDSTESQQKRADAIMQILRNLRQTSYALTAQMYKEQLQALDDAQSKQKSEYEERAASQTKSVIEDKSLTQLQKANAIRKIELDLTRLLLAAEVAAAKNALEEKEKALLQGLTTEREVAEARNKLRQAELAKSKQDAEDELTIIGRLTQGLKNALGNITGFFKGVKADRELIEAAINRAKEIASSTVNDAMQLYFDSQNQRIDKEREAAMNLIDLQQQQAESVASSEAEKEIIRRKFDKKREEAEKAAGEEKKKVALKQAAIDFAVAVVKTLAAYPFPFSLIPVAALGIQYAVQRSQIQAQKFEHGGEVPKRTGGRISGKRHAHGGVPFNYEAEDGELMIINRRSANDKDRYNITGTPRQIASAVNRIGGGINFAGGAKLRKFELGGSLGGNLKAPRGFSATGNFDFSNEYGKMSEIIKMQQGMIIEQARAIQSVSEKVQTLKVAVVASEVVETDGNIKRAKSIATL